MQDFLLTRGKVKSVAFYIDYRGCSHLLTSHLSLFMCPFNRNGADRSVFSWILFARHCDSLLLPLFPVRAEVILLATNSTSFLTFPISLSSVPGFLVLFTIYPRLMSFLNALIGLSVLFLLLQRGLPFSFYTILLALLLLLLPKYLKFLLFHSLCLVAWESERKKTRKTGFFFELWWCLFRAEKYFSKLQAALFSFVFFAAFPQQPSGASALSCVRKSHGHGVTSLCFKCRFNVEFISRMGF